MTWVVEERLPYGGLRFCQFPLLLVIFPEIDDFSRDQEQDQDQEQEQELKITALPPSGVCGITKRTP